jgi:hypothetical protein
MDGPRAACSAYRCLAALAPKTVTGSEARSEARSEDWLGNAAALTMPAPLSRAEPRAPLRVPDRCRAHTRGQMPPDSDGAVASLKKCGFAGLQRRPHMCKQEEGENLAEGDVAEQGRAVAGVPLLRVLHGVSHAPESQGAAESGEGSSCNRPHTEATEIDRVRCCGKRAAIFS